MRSDTVLYWHKDEASARLQEFISNAVRDQMDRQSLTVLDLSRLTGVGRTPLYQRLNNRNRWGILDLYRTAAVLGLDVADLLPPASPDDGRAGVWW